MSGDRIRPELLVDELRVSTTTVRESLIQLAAERLITEVPKSGFFAKNLAHARYANEYKSYEICPAGAGSLIHPRLKTGCSVYDRIDGRHVGKHCVAIKPGKIDRSPTGTAVSARLAQMHARGEASVGDEVVFQSLLGSEFVGCVEKETTLAGKQAILPSVRGRAWLTDTRQLMLDPSDPWPTGYKLGDTWPNGI